MNDNRTTEENTRDLIIQNTPPGQDPVVYWHQVAMDAVRSSEKGAERAFAASQERDQARRDLELFTSRLISQAAREKERVPLDISRLIEMVRDGAIDLNLSFYISRASNREA